MRLKRLWSPDGPEEKELYLARFFSALLHRYLVSVSTGAKGPMGRPLRLTRALLGPITSDAITTLRRLSCKTKGAVGSARCSYWNQPDPDASWQSTCGSCSRPLMPWDALVKAIKEHTELEVRALTAWRAGEPISVGSATTLWKAAAKAGLIDQSELHNQLTVLTWQETAVKALQRVRRELRRPPGNGSSAASLWAHLMAEDEAACFVWDRPSEKYLSALLPASSIDGVVVDEGMVPGVSGRYFPDEVPPIAVKGIESDSGIWIDGYPFFYKLTVSLGRPNHVEVVDAEAERRILVVLVLRPARDDEEAALAKRSLKAS